MEQEIIDLLHSKNQEDIKLGIEIMHIKYPELFIYNDQLEKSTWFIPMIMRPLIINDISIGALSIIHDYCVENNYYKIKG